MRFVIIFFIVISGVLSTANVNAEVLNITDTSYNAVYWNNSDTEVIYGTSYGSIGNWDPQSEYNSETIFPHYDGITDFHIDKNGLGVSASGEENAYVWDYKLMEEKYKITVINSSINGVEFYPDETNKILLGLDNGSIQVVDISLGINETDYLTDFFFINQTIVKMEFSPDDSFLALVLDGGNITVIDFESKLIAFTVDEQTDDLQYLSWNSQSNQLVITYMTSKIVIWDVVSKTMIKEFKPENHLSYTSAVISPNGKYLAVGDYSSIHIYDIETWEVVYYSLIGNSLISNIDWASDSIRLAIGSDSLYVITIGILQDVGGSTSFDWGLNLLEIIGYILIGILIIALYRYKFLRKIHPFTLILWILKSPFRAFLGYYYLLLTIFSSKYKKSIFYKSDL